LRTASGYRCYEQRDLDRVRFIRLCQGLGFTLREVRQLLDLHARVAECKGTRLMQPEAVSEILEIAGERFAAIDQKIRELNTMRAELASLVNALSPGSLATCPISHEKAPA
jgi:MerR family copper efflux transcriptional regulator